MTYNKWKKLADEGYSSDVISFLLFLQQGESIDEEHPKSKALISLMERKELVVDGKISVKGLSLLNSMEEIGNIPTKAIKSDKFEEWWKAYPSTDAFSIDGTNFIGTQSKRIKKDVCKKTFNKLINEGITAEDIINATQYHFEQAKKLSVKKNENKLSFIANSERYLRERMFEPYIEMAKKVEEIEEYKSNIL